jgi:penicillin-binding protein 1A
MQLYLAIAPWGGALCGGEAAAQHYLGKPAARLTAIEAAWLAGMLRNPQAAANSAENGSIVDVPRLQTVLENLRPAGKAQRRALIRQAAVWQPAQRKNQ